MFRFIKKPQKWIVVDTGCVECGVDIVGGFETKKKANDIAALLNRHFLEGRLDILNAYCDGNGQHLFQVFEMPEDEHINIKYN